MLTARSKRQIAKAPSELRSAAAFLAEDHYLVRVYFSKAEKRWMLARAPCGERYWDGGPWRERFYLWEVDDDSRKRSESPVGRQAVHGVGQGE